MTLSASRGLVLATTAALLAGGAAIATTAEAVGPAPARAHGTVVLAGQVLRHLPTRSAPSAAYALVGPTAGDTPVEIDVTIQRPHEAAELAAYTAMYTPGSPTYHQFLTVDEFDQRYGVPASTYDQVRDYATRHGLRVVGHPGSNDIVRLTGTAEQAEDTFAVTLDDYRVIDPTKSEDPLAPKGAVFYANSNAPTVPGGLGIQGVIGLNSLLRMHLPQHAPGSTPKGATHGTAPAQDTCLPTGTCTGTTTPQDLWSVYHQPGGATADPNGNLRVDFGQGQQMAIFGEGQTDPAVSNLRIFETLHHLPRMPVTVVRTDGPKADYSSTDGEGEWEIDTQASSGMAPDAQRLVLYFGKDLSDADVLGVFSSWADDPDGPLQASASYGECEENPVGDALTATGAPLSLPDGGYAGSSGAAYTLKSEATLRKAAMLGKTLFSSSGDTGSSCPVVFAAVIGAGNGVLNQAFPVVSYPASSPYAVSVGGTVLYTTSKQPAARAMEYPWTFGGGGSSQVFTKPTYQDGITQILGVCDWSPGGGAANVGKPCRGVPDVAAQSGDVATNGYGIVFDGETNYPGGGTSLSSPLWLGMWTRIQAAAPGQRACGGSIDYRGLGFANPVLYQAFKGKTGGRDFYDIGGDNDGVPPKNPSSGNGYFLATPGWDYVSGMGTPNVSNLVRDLTGDTSLAPAHPVLPKQPAASTQARPDACTPLFTDDTGDDSYPAGTTTGNNPQLDIVAGNIDYVTKDASGKAGQFLKTVMAISDLSTKGASPAGGGNEYYFLWTYKGTQYFSSVQVDTTGAVTYGDGTVDGTTYNTKNSDDTGEFHPGKDGTVVVYVPLANVGNPAQGATLSAPAAQSKVLVGTGATGGLIEVADSSDAHFDYHVGESCTKDSSGIAPGPYSTTGNAPPYTVAFEQAGALPPVAASGTPHVVGACTASSAPARTTGGTATPVTEPAAAHGRLAYTGLNGAVPATAVLLVAAGLGLAWRRRRAD